MKWQMQVTMEMVKQEMSILEGVEKPGAGVDDYVASLQKILRRKARIVEGLRRRLARFKKHLDAEETLTESFKRR